MDSLIYRWQPVTQDFGLIKASVDEVLSAIQEWRSSLGQEISIRRVPSLTESFGALEPLSVSKRRSLLLATRANWTAFFQNGIQGSDPVPSMSYLARAMGAIAMRVASSPGSNKDGAIWEVYAPEAMGGMPPMGYRRSVAVVRDGSHWVFEMSGEPYEFEDQVAYRAPRRCDRFIGEMLRAYVAEFGLFPYRDDFYIACDKQPGVLIENLHAWDRAPRQFTRQQVLEGMLWTKD